MASDALLKFAMELKTLREEKGVSLVQISNRTKIDVKFLHAIEEARFEVLPELYIRAFIKEYSQTIDVNPKSILAKFDVAKSGKEEISQKGIPSQNETPVIEKAVEEPAEPESNIEANLTTTSANESVAATKTPSSIKLNYILGGIVLLVAGAIAYFAFVQEYTDKIIASDSRSGNNTSRYEVSQPVQIEKDSVSQTPVVMQNTVPVQPVVKSDSLQLSVQTTDRVWVKIYRDGKVVFQKMVEKGTNLQYKAKNKFSVSVGDAGAVKIFYNEKQVPNVGKTGESRNVYMAPDGIRYYTISGNEKKSTPSN
jgi:cytoskeletal protein RodZ